MRNNTIIYITEFLALLAIVVNSIQFLLFSLVGIEYNPEEGTGLVAIVNVSCCLYTVAWVLIKEMTVQRPVHPIWWPYFLPFIIIFLFFMESTFNYQLKINTFAGKQLIFFGVEGVPAIFLSTYIYRYNRFDIVTRNSDIIMLICTIALGLKIPAMLSGGIGHTSIGGSGGHQEISYSAAFCFLINWINIITGNTQDRFNLFEKKVWRYLFFAFLPLQAIVCILGGGRGGALLLIIGFVITTFIFLRHRFSKSLPWVFITVSILAYLAVQFGETTEGFGRTFDYIGNSGIDLDSDLQRRELRQESYRIISESPIIGHGLWNGLAYANFFAHNIFLDVLISGGVVYLFIFILAMIKSMRGCVKLFINDSSKSVFFAWVLYPAVMLLVSGYYLNSSYFWFAFLSAFLPCKSTRRV